MNLPKPLPKTITIGDKYNPAMELQTQEEADHYFLVLVSHSMTHFSKSKKEAEKIERENLAYWAGYYDDEMRTRIERLFKCIHPIFGSILEHGAPTPEEAYKLGFEKGNKARAHS